MFGVFGRSLWTSAEGRKFENPESTTLSPASSPLKDVDLVSISPPVARHLRRAPSANETEKRQKHPEDWNLDGSDPECVTSASGLLQHLAVP